MSLAARVDLQTLGATALAMAAFAANSILCRLALGPPDIDAVGFTSLRLASGALTLLAIARLTGRRRTARSAGTWTSGAALFVYAILFSIAYLELGVSTGALILFALVQATMIGWGLARGERPHAIQWAGLVIALGGFLYLVSPGLSAPSPLGSLMMAGAGMAWGVYSLRGRGTPDPIVTTTDNFVRSLPPVIALVVLFHGDLELSPRGVALAITSGAVASGMGYVLWYAALRRLSAARAASVQLSVPVLAGGAGLVFLDEPATLRLGLSAVLILGGIGLTLIGKDEVGRPPG
jgi:drug/metabolite transporter (DMT)-like permease